MTTELASSSAIPNVLAERYASPAMKDIWSPAGRIAIERDFWIAVMKAQRDLGVAIPAEAIADYERVKDKIDLATPDLPRDLDEPVAHDVELVRPRERFQGSERRRDGGRSGSELLGEPSSERRIQVALHPLHALE